MLLYSKQGQLVAKIGVKNSNITEFEAVLDCKLIIVPVILYL